MDEAITELKNNKAPGTNNIQAELLKHATKELRQKILELIQRNGRQRFYLWSGKWDLYARCIKKETRWYAQTIEALSSLTQLIKSFQRYYTKKYYPMLRKI